MRSSTGLVLMATALAMSACTAAPSVTRERTTMTIAEIEAQGLICRKDRRVDTNTPRTICASEQAWAEFDERRRLETDDLLADARKAPNAGRFRRD